MIIKLGGDLTVNDNCRRIALHYAVLSKDGPEVAKNTLNKEAMRVVVKTEPKKNNEEEEEEEDNDNDNEGEPKKGTAKRGKSISTRSSKRARRSSEVEALQEASMKQTF
jgi:hypothetical protein